MAEIVDIVRVSLGGDSAAVQETLQALVELEGKMIAQWGINVELNASGVAYTSGVSLVLAQEGGVVRSAFNVLADSFNVMHSVNGQPQAVFSVQGGAAIMNTALIGTASIKSAHIESLDALKIESQNLATVLANIGTAYIDSGHMKQGSVKRLHVGVAEIDTLRVAGNAITIVGYASSPAANPTSVNRETSVTINLPAASTVVLEATYATVSADDTSFMRYWLVNGTTGATIRSHIQAISHFSGASNNNVRPGGQFSAVYTAPAGTTKFVLRQDNGTGHWAEVSLRVEAFMR